MSEPIQITVGNSLCQLHNAPMPQKSFLRNKLSYSESVRGRFNRFTSVRRYLMGKDGVFPTGLLYLVKEVCKKQGWAYTLQDARKRPRTRERWGSSLIVNMKHAARPEQDAAAQAALMGERGIIVAPTGCGKSLIAALVLDEFQVRSLLVVPSLGLKNQLTADLTEMFGKGFVGPLVNGKAKHLFTVENIDQLDPKKPIEGIDLVMVDEFHHSGAKSYRDLNEKAWKDVYFKFGLTATPFRSKSEERLLLESVLSKVIYRIPYDVALAKGYICPMDIFYVELPKLEMKGKGKIWNAVYKELVVDREDRNEIICDFIEKLHTEGKSTLVLLKQVEHGLKLQHEISKRGVHVPFAKGDNGDNDQLIQRFNDRKDPVLIGTAVIGEGIDTRPTEFVILAGGGKSKNQFMQNVGRLFRNHPSKERAVVIMFYDPSHRWTANHFAECMQYCRDEYGIEPTKLSMA